MQVGKWLDLNGWITSTVRPQAFKCVRIPPNIPRCQLTQPGTDAASVVNAAQENRLKPQQLQSSVMADWSH
jgi:hypothetical protein